MRTIFELVCVLVLVGCGGSMPGPDAGATDASRDDAGSADDAGGDAAIADGGSDAGPADGGHPCIPACGAGTACVGGVCVDDCGGDLAALGDAVGDQLTVLGNVCRSIAFSPYDVVASGGDDVVYEVSTATEGTTTTFTLSRWTLDLATPTPTVETVATTTYEASGTEMVFGGGYVAISPDESQALFGYTTDGDGFVGGVFDVLVGDGTSLEVAANGNFDAEWVDGSRWIVNGLGLATSGGDEQGLYLFDQADGSASQLADEMGANSGAVAVTETVIVAGAFAGFGSTWPDASEGGRVFVIDRAEALAATAPLSAWDDALARFEGPSSFELLSGMRIASTRYDDAFAVEAIESRALTETGGTWSLGDPVDLTHGAAFTSVASLPGGRLMLTHAGGVLIVEE